jgi:hypothetical protein
VAFDHNVVPKACGAVGAGRMWSSADVAVEEADGFAALSIRQMGSELLDARPAGVRE